MDPGIDEGGSSNYLIIGLVVILLLAIIGVVVYFVFFRGEDGTVTAPVVTIPIENGIAPTGSTTAAPAPDPSKDLSTSTPPAEAAPSAPSVVAKDLGTQEMGQECNDTLKCKTGFECRKGLCIDANAPTGCFYGPFGGFSSCSENCGGGEQSRMRLVVKEDGTKCNFASFSESKPCNLQACSTVPQHAGYTVEQNVDYFGGDMPNMPVGPFENVNQCAQACADKAGCQSYSYLSGSAPWVKENPADKGKCYLKNKIGQRRSSAGIQGGKKI
tara:strand:+ start:2112 stop:2924 length:813 start_codon:yes stop_codon:yes gene_type:complete